MNQLRHFGITRDIYSRHKKINPSTAYHYEPSTYAYKVILERPGQIHIYTGSLLKETDAPKIVKEVLALDKEYQAANPATKKKLYADLLRDVTNDVKSDVNK